MVSDTTYTQARTPQSVQVRAAQPEDVPAIAALLVEGFGHEYGGLMGQPAGQRATKRIQALPGRIRGVVVAVNGQDTPVGVAGLRTSDMYTAWELQEQLILQQEFGLVRMLQLELFGSFIEPAPYQVKRHEGFVYGVAVTGAWRGRGVGDALMEHLHASALARGKTVVVLEVSEQNSAARKLYERHGYVIRNQRRGLLGWLPFGPTPRLLLEKRLYAS